MMPANVWRFSRAPREFCELFPEAEGVGLGAHLPKSRRLALEPTLVRWKEVSSIHSVVLPDQSVA
jgi:hypothetical protein